MSVIRFNYSPGLLTDWCTYRQFGDNTLPEMSNSTFGSILVVKFGGCCMAALHTAGLIFPKHHAYVSRSITRYVLGLLSIGSDYVSRIIFK